MKASLDEAVDWIIHDYIVSHPGDIGDESDLINYVLSNLATPTSHSTDETKEGSALITTAPELHPRIALPQPQDGNDCSAQASRSATDAIRQANQQASESIRQANQSASQGIQQASQSATNAIRQAGNDASQTIAQLSRGSSSISSSANSAIASIQSSADQAISRANNSARTAQANASQAILQASAAIAAATGSAAAAGSAFLEQAARAATQGQVTNQLPTELAANKPSSYSPPTTGVSATQAALAIVGSIIASSLITFLIYFLCQRHRKKVQLAEQISWGLDGGIVERKFSGSTINASHVTINKSTRIDISRTTPAQSSKISLSLFPQTPTVTSQGKFPTNSPTKPATTTSPDKRTPAPSPPVKHTAIPWNPSYPPAPPKIGSSFLSPAGAIKLPVDTKSNLPLGGQLKSPLTTDDNSRIHKAWDLPLRAIPSPSPAEVAMKTSLSSPYPKPQSTASKERQRQREKLREIPAYLPSPLKRQYSAAKASVWTEDGASETGSVKSAVSMRKDKEMDGIRKSERWTEGLRTPVDKMEGMSEGVRTPRTTGVIVDATALDLKKVGMPSRLKERREGR